LAFSQKSGRITQKALKRNGSKKFCELFCQEFATLGDAAVGDGLLARSHILRVRINILTIFFFNIKIHSIFYTII
jgi:hypothetical protein